MAEVIKKAKLVVDANGVAIQSPLHPFPTVTALDLDISHISGSLAGIEIVRLCANEACFVKFGRDDGITSVADTDTYLPANVPEYFALRGDLYIAAIKATGGAGTGHLFITPME
jgi:hypothetical protein